MKLRIITAACICAALCLCGCEEEESSGSPASTGQTTAAVTQQQTSPVEVRKYEFPSFLGSEATADMLANIVSVGFDPAQSVTDAVTSPIEDVRCDKCFLGEYYTFNSKGHIGIANSNGAVIIEPGKYTGAELVSNELIKLNKTRSEDGVFDMLQVRDGVGRLVDAEFDPDNISVTELPGEDESKPAQYCLAVRGKNDLHTYDSIEPLSKGALRTSRIYSAAYKASAGGRYYYLIFDEYYNLTICEAAYAQIRMKIAGTYGECYILNGDHYSELSKMIKSFGSEQQAVKPNKDETLDYIQIVFGICAGDQLTVTVSADGFCLTDGLTVKGQPINKYFSVYPKETFTDLVNWVGDVVSTEYARHETASPQV